MKVRKFNLIASMTAFSLGTLFVFSDKFSITANVVGASGGNTGIVALMGMGLIIGAIGLFIVSMTSHDHNDLDLERLIRGNSRMHRELKTEEMYDKEKADEKYEEYTK